MKKYAVLALTAVFSSGALADYYGGNDIASWSNARLRAKAGTASSTDYVEAGTLRGLAIGVHDSFEGTAICSPPGATNGQIVDTVTVYVDNHPEKRTENASKLALEALMKAYPCNR